MSPLWPNPWRDQVRILLCPRQIALLRLSRGRPAHVIERRTVWCDATSPGEPLWRNAITVLATVLPEFGTRTADAVVLLSNHFVRYTLVSHSNEISSESEEEALTRHHFTRIHGAAAEQWALCMSGSGGRDRSRLASAVDQALLDALREQFKPTRLNLNSIQPYLMSAFNQWRRTLDDSGWLALVEQGTLCLARFHNRRWYSIKAFKIGDDWFGDLAVQLEREKVLTESDMENSVSEPLFIYAPGYGETPPLQAQRYSLKRLGASNSGAIEAPYAMALLR